MITGVSTHTHTLLIPFTDQKSSKFDEIIILFFCGLYFWYSENLPKILTFSSFSFSWYIQGQLCVALVKLKSILWVSVSAHMLYAHSVLMCFAHTSLLPR